MSRVVKLPVDQVIVGDRHRKELGDIDALAQSILSVGLLHPIVVTERHRLVAGHRRFEAWQQIHGTKVPIPAHVVDSVDSARLHLMAERDENTCRKDFAPSEAVALGLALEAIEKPRAEEREKAGKAPSGNLPQGPTGKTRDIVAPAVGMSPRTYDKAKAVVAASEDRKLPAEVRATAKEAVAEMDRSGKVDGAFRKVEVAKVNATPVSQLIDNDEDIAALGYRRTVLKMASACARLVSELDAERTAAVADLDTLDALDAIAQSLPEFVQRVHSARKGLRVVNGGKA